MARRRVLVTGGLGFQGSHLGFKLLERGDAVTLLSTPSQRNYVALHSLYASMDKVSCPKNRVRVVLGSVADAEILEKTLPGHDAIIHMAAWASVDASLERPWPAFEVNAQGTLAVLEACRRFGDKDLKLIIASSCEVYGPATVYRASMKERAILDAKEPGSGERYRRAQAQDEDSPMLPRSPYAASKIAADRHAYAHAITYDMDITILRPCNIYGPGQLATAMGAVIPKMTRAALMGQALLVTGEGKQFREFLHVNDLVTAYLRVLDALRGEPGETYNVGSGVTQTIQALAEAISQMMSPRAPIQYVPARTADVSGFLLDSSRFRKQFDWSADVLFPDGLAQYVQWARIRQAQENPQ
jgi:nucleoside-diphosphate-sugar epimerase